MNHFNQAEVIHLSYTGCSILVVLVLSLTACQPSISSVPANTATPFDIAERELHRQEQKWQEAGIRHYRFRLFRGCICLENEDVLIEVENGKIISLEYQSGKSMESGARTEFEGWSTMEKLFSTVETELRGESLKVTVTYDPSYGFPVDVFSERSTGSDDELNLTISDFEVIPPTSTPEGAYPTRGEHPRGRCPARDPATSNRGRRTPSGTMTQAVRLPTITASQFHQEPR